MIREPPLHHEKYRSVKTEGNDVSFPHPHHVSSYNQIHTVVALMASRWGETGYGMDEGGEEQFKGLAH